jgi:hypothetical protein
MEAGEKGKRLWLGSIKEKLPEVMAVHTEI